MKSHPYKPLLIYTVGRVSSTTIYNICKQETCFHPYHVHYLTPEKIEAQLAVAERTNAKGQDLIQAIEYTKRKHEYDGQLKIINIIREPISRTLSLFFSTGQVHDSDLIQLSDNSICWDNILDKFLKYNRHTEFEQWLGDEFEKFTGFDLLKSNYKAKYGCGRTTTKEFDILTFQCELSENRKIKILNHFLSSNIKKLSHDYSTKERTGGSVGDIYSQFINNVPLPIEYIDYIYNLKSFRFLYTKDQHKAFKKKWLK